MKKAEEILSNLPVNVVIKIFPIKKEDNLQISLSLSEVKTDKRKK